MIRKNILLIISVLGSISLAFARIRRGSCPEPSLEEEFDITSYLGRWYEIFRDAETPFEADCVCVTADYSLNFDGTLQIINQCYNTEKEKRIKAKLKAKCEGSYCDVIQIS